MRLILIFEAGACYEKQFNRLSPLYLFCGIFYFTSTVKTAEELLLYSARAEHLLKPLISEFEKENPGVKLKYVTDKAPALLERLKAEGKRSPADILMTVDAGNLWQAVENGLLESVDSKLLQNKIPEFLRDSQGRWFGISIRARTIVITHLK